MASTDVNAQIQQILGRAATPQELEFYNKFMQSEGLTAQEIGNMLQATPEFQGQQLNRDVDAFGGRLAASDQGLLDQAAATAQSRFASLGRPTTSAQVGAFSQAAQNLAQNRQSALASFYGQGLQGNRALSQGYGQQFLERGYGLRDEARQRAYQVEDRNYMKGLYDDYLRQQRSSARSGALGSLALGTAGALGGAYLGSLAGPGGAMAGARLGGSLGSQGGGLFQ